MTVRARFVAENYNNGRMDFVGPSAPQLIGLVNRALRGWLIERILPKDKEYLFVDAGACVGSWSIVMALHFPQSRVICFEPFKENFECLQRNAKGIPNIEMYSMALSDRDERITLRFPLGRENIFTGLFHGRDNYGLMSDYGDDKDGQIAIARKLDDLVEGVNVLKIDVEGMEMRVLDGAERILTHDRPVLQVEMRMENQDRAGYTVDELLHKITSYDYVPMKETDQVDCIFIPKELVKDV